jgi:uncharacterized membrane protein YbaN (DUF454 family)
MHALRLKEVRKMNKNAKFLLIFGIVLLAVGITSFFYSISAVQYWDGYNSGLTAVNYPYLALGFISILIGIILLVLAALAFVRSSFLKIP